MLILIIPLTLCAAHVGMAASQSAYITLWSGFDIYWRACFVFLKSSGVVGRSMWIFHPYGQQDLKPLRKAQEQTSHSFLPHLAKWRMAEDWTTGQETSTDHSDLWTLLNSLQTLLIIMLETSLRSRVLHQSADSFTEAEDTQLSGLLKDTIPSSGAV